MNYCSNCGQRVVLRIPSGDDRLRYVCDACHTTHYQNPRVVTGCIPQWNDQILLCRRAIEPRHGMWTLPAGFLENGETTAEAAARETLEEANARVMIDAPFSLIDIPRINQIYVMFRAHLLALDYSPGSESLEVRLFREAEIPWDRLAFPAVEQTLVLFFEDRRNGLFRMHNETVWRRPGEPRRY